MNSTFKIIRAYDINFYRINVFLNPERGRLSLMGILDHNQVIAEFDAVIAAFSPLPVKDLANPCLLTQYGLLFFLLNE